MMDSHDGSDDAHLGPLMAQGAFDVDAGKILMFTR